MLFRKLSYNGNFSKSLYLISPKLPKSSLNPIYYICYSILFILLCISSNGSREKKSFICSCISLCIDLIIPKPPKSSGVFSFLSYFYRFLEELKNGSLSNGDEKSKNPAFLSSSSPNTSLNNSSAL